MNTYPPSPLTRWMIILTVMLVATLEVLDSTIVNVSLPNMMGSLGASSDTITWVLTAYIVSSAIFMPLTGFLSRRLGRKNLLIIAVLGFMFSSMLCGISENLAAMVSFRFIQGMFGAALIPLSQATLRDAFSKDEQMKAMSIWGIGIMAAPILGPTLGGYITAYADWRWIFYINIPVCALAILFMLRYVPKTEKFSQAVDWLGLILMGSGLGALQLMLDQGDRYDWFDSHFMILLCLISIFGLLFFCLHSLNTKFPLINLRLFRDFNFTLSTIMVAIFAGSALSLLIVQPLMLEQLMNYPVETAGLIMAPRGFASAAGMAFAGALGKKISPRYFLIIGLLSSFSGAYCMSFYTLNVSQWDLIWPGLIQGFGMGMFFVTISAVGFRNVPPTVYAEAAGLFGYGRLLGTSIGISLITTLISHTRQTAWQEIGSHIQFSNPNLVNWLAKTHLNFNDPATQMHLLKEVERQASMTAYIDAYHVIAHAFLLLLPLTFLLSLKSRG